MNEKEAKKRITLLSEQINKWNYEYFILNNPSVSDYTYDLALKELEDLEKTFPNLKNTSSPTNSIGFSLDNERNFKKVVHNKTMMSLNKAYSIDEIKKFLEDINKIVNIENNKLSFFIEPKIDGLSINLKYENGLLIEASTRGNGKIGEDVTNNVKNIIDDIPSKIEYPFPLEVRGEIYIEKDNFLQINKLNNFRYANPRNLASGTLRQLNNKIVKERNLRAFLYEIVDPSKHNLNSQNDVFSFLKQQKFVVNNLAKKINTNEIESFLDFFKNEKDNLNYECDGVVIKLNENKYYNQIGFTSKFPKYAIAYKYNEEIATTKLLNIFASVGRSGIITYNASLESILLNGTNVCAATLHNYNYVKELNLNINDFVFIKKAGEIIPKVVGVAHKNSFGVFEKIINCPSCNFKLIETKTLNMQQCINPLCPEQQIKKIIYFASRECANIEGLGDQIVRKFYNLNLLKSIEDIFHLKNKKNEIINIKGFGEKFFNNLIQNIDNVKNIKIENLIASLGIGNLGIKGALILAKQIKEFKNILFLNEEQLINLHEFGPIIVDQIISFIKNEANKKLVLFFIDQLKINPSFVENNLNIKDNLFKGKNVLITGSFSKSRKYLVQCLLSLGANCLNSFSSNVNILICGEKPGSKLKKALENKEIKIIYEDELKNILVENNLW